VAERVAGLAVIIIRQAGESGSLYGSVVSRDIAVACTEAGLTVTREQVLLGEPIKAVGVSSVQVELHPEVQIPVVVNVARSREEAEKQTRGENAAAAAQAESLEAELAAEMAATEEAG
jgi:large subunit ribosomal protein L9